MITTQDLDHFFEGLQIRLEAANTTRRELDRYLSSGFNLIDVLYPDENRLSHVLSKLLDPNGGHGQGAKFLELFCSELLSTAKIESRDLNFKAVKVRVEEQTFESRRIDIIIEFGTQFAIGIENKPWAADQEKQLDHYAIHLEKMYADYVLVYLAGYATEASDYSISQQRRKKLAESGKFVEIKFNPHLFKWLENSALVCEAEKTRWFLRDFAVWIEKNFPNSETANKGDI